MRFEVFNLGKKVRDTSWSKDGQRILFGCPNRWEIEIFEVQDEITTELAYPTREEGPVTGDVPTWHPDQDKIYYGYSIGIRLYDFLTQTEELFVPGPDIDPIEALVRRDGGYISELRVSPDERQVAVVQVAYGEGSYLFTMAPDCSRMTQLIFVENSHAGPSNIREISWHDNNIIFSANNEITLLDSGDGMKKRVLAQGAHPLANPQKPIVAFWTIDKKSDDYTVLNLFHLGTKKNQTFHLERGWSLSSLPRAEWSNDGSILAIPTRHRSRTGSPLLFFNMDKGRFVDGEYPTMDPSGKISWRFDDKAIAYTDSKANLVILEMS